jgi:hypothetical protein
MGNAGPAAFAERNVPWFGTWFARFLLAQGSAAMKEPDTENPPDSDVESLHVHGPLGVEKLEGRQEGGRDAQDEAEEDEPDASTMPDTIQ